MSPEESDKLWSIIIVPVIENFKGNAERFYSEFYELIQLGKLEINSLPNHLITLLLTEVANLCLLKLIEAPGSIIPSSSENAPSTEDFIEKDIQIIQYLTGYCFRIVFNKIRKSKSWESNYAQQCLSVLKAAKNEATDSQELITSRDRGGLWKMGDKAIHIYKICEKTFVKATQEFTSNIDININTLVSQLMMDSCIKSNFTEICNSAECLIDRGFKKLIAILD